MVGLVAIIIFAVTFLAIWRSSYFEEKCSIYSRTKPVFKINGGVLMIDWETFGLSATKRFLAYFFPKVVIVLGSGKELYFYKGLKGKMFVYEGCFSVYDELQYKEINELYLTK